MSPLIPRLAVLLDLSAPRGGSRRIRLFLTTPAAFASYREARPPELYVLRGYIRVHCTLRPGTLQTSFRGTMSEGTNPHPFRLPPELRGLSLLPRSDSHRLDLCVLSWTRLRPSAFCKYRRSLAQVHQRRRSRNRRLFLFLDRDK